MNSSIEDIIECAKEVSGTKEIKEDTDLFNAGIVGDDFHDMIYRYSKKYSVNLDTYLWYFHADEEGGWNSIGGLLFSPPYNRVKRIPVTPLMLQEFAIKGKWDIPYPKHKLPKYRLDIIINQVVGTGALIILIYFLFNKCTN